jgi:cold-inducible RNA-binding protein
MSVRLFVGNLSYDTTETELREFFAPVGPLTTVIIPMDRETGKRRGFAFVEFSDKAQAEDASRQLNNQPFKGRNITINEARARESRPDSGPGPRPGNPMRPAGTIRTSRPPFTPRPSPGGTEFIQDTTENDRTARAERRNRNFGADAKPSRKRKPQHGNKGEMGGRKKPLRERSGGQIFGSYEDDSYYEDDQDDDFLADFREPKEE